MREEGSTVESEIRPADPVAVMEVKSGAHLARQAWRRSFWSMMFANQVGASFDALFVLVVMPPPLSPHEFNVFRLQTLILAPIDITVCVWIALCILRRRFAPVVSWLNDDRPPTEAERRTALRWPWVFVTVSYPFWFGSAVFFGVLAGSHASDASHVIGAGVAVLVTVALGGIASLALGYLMLERGLRPVTAHALASISHAEELAPGITARLTIAWTLSTAVPVIGVLAIAAWYLAGGDFAADKGFTAILVLSAAVLAVGLAAIFVAARSIADPVAAMRSALGRVEDGEFDARVAIDDASEVGLLQAGFNHMTAGLAERERIREAFGTYVDHEVAEHILREGTALAGEEVEVTMMFLDIRNFTGFAERFTAQQVVATVNRLWEQVVPIIHAYGGHVDKFIGDGLLAVFGAPRRQHDHADQALSAALEIAGMVEAKFGGELGIGLGLNSGTVVAGNVGGAGRLEFSVIGDAVNIAARVESATRQTGDVILVSQHTKQLLTRHNRPLESRPQVPLKGKTEAIVLYAPTTPTYQPETVA